MTLVGLFRALMRESLPGLLVCATLVGMASAAPQRIVAIGGSVTEIVFALGEGHRLAAVDSTSVFPEDTRTLPNVGYMRALAAEGVLSLQPDLILAIEGAGPPPVLSVLQASSVPVVMIPEAHTPEGILAKIRSVGEALGVADKAAQLAENVAADLETARAEAAAVDAHPRAAFVLSVSDGKLMVAGRDTSADAMLALAGAENVFSDFAGFKPVGMEALIAAAPEVIVVMNRHGSQPAEQILGLPGIALTPAGRAGAVVAMEGSYLLGFGPRTADALRDLSHNIASASR